MQRPWPLAKANGFIRMWGSGIFNWYYLSSAHPDPACPAAPTRITGTDMCVCVYTKYGIYIYTYILYAYYTMPVNSIQVQPLLCEVPWEWN